MGKDPSGAGDTPARGAGVMSISSALDAAKAEFARNVKDSEEVMAVSYTHLTLPTILLV